MPLSPIEEDKVPMLHAHRLSYDDVDIEDSASETTHVGSSSPPQKRSRASSWLSSTSTTPPSPSPASRRSVCIILSTYFRFFIIVTLQSLILVTLHYPSFRQRFRESSPVLRGLDVETGSDVNGLYTTLSHTYNYLKPEAETYFPNTTNNLDRDAIRRNWDNLMPLGSGSVAIPEHESYPLLGNPITDDPLRSGPLYEASWTHSLHCLYHLVDSYHQLLLLASPLLADSYLDPISVPEGFEHEPDPVHFAHCSEYLRTSVLCNLDMTLEGSASTMAEKGRGQGHVCRNREEAVKWIESRRVDDRKDIVGPDAIPLEENEDEA
ncbi:uncharacterized protein AB675_11399 [Cyphellophora attinorum]|uniref:Uncharacterized protein n=1 Tax=Cyphellophora attinorum TaxID=1664694 RepID=A0A0N1H9F2_9EURO|nr:uncharacterized protein AB675_11399 [Phialophora attinorum]KPI40195.1 hypothetical protein AB675_11399 [Phialophora attinorum]